LERLHLWNSQVSEEQLKALKAALPGCSIVSDLLDGEQQPSRRGTVKSV